MEILLTILGGSVGATVCAGVFQLIQWWLNRKAKTKDDAGQRQADQCEARGTEIAAIRTSVDALYAANRVILYDRIKHLGKTYISRGRVTTEELEDLTAMHDCYHNDLSGNGFLDGLMEQVHMLPIR